MTTRDEGTTFPRSRKTTLGLLLATVFLTVVAFIVGIADNPPGIFLLYAAGLTLVLAFSHRWRNPKAFGLLLLASALGFLVTVVIHNFAEVGADRIAHIPVLSLPLAAISVVSFLLAVIVCPAGILVGMVGGIITAARTEPGPA